MASAASTARLADRGDRVIAIGIRSARSSGGRTRKTRSDETARPATMVASHLGGHLVDTSSRTTCPNRRRESSCSTASTRSNGLPEISSSASRVTRKAAASAIRIPGNRAPRCCAMMFSRATKVVLRHHQKPGKDLGNLDAGEPPLARDRVLDEHAEREREVRDVREGRAWSDGERRQDRKDALRERHRQSGLLRASRCSGETMRMPSASSAAGSPGRRAARGCARAPRRSRRSGPASVRQSDRRDGTVPASAWSSSPATRTM